MAVVEREFQTLASAKYREGTSNQQAASGRPLEFQVQDKRGFSAASFSNVLPDRGSESSTEPAQSGLFNGTQALRQIVGLHGPDAPNTPALQSPAGVCR